jgi:hypothetical protein
MYNYSIKSQMINIQVAILLMVLMNTGCFSQGNNSTGKKHQETTVTITPEQKTQIKTILSKYNPSTLTAEQAKEIHEKFRAAGIHPGPETKEAIVAAGFDPEKLRTLAPPPGKDGKAGNKPPSLEERMKLVDEKIIKPLSLNSSQSETVNSAFKEFFTGMDKVRESQESNQVPPDKTKIEPIEKSRDEKIKQILSGEQFVKYQELEKSARPPKPDQKENK